MSLHLQLFGSKGWSTFDVLHEDSPRGSIQHNGPGGPIVFLFQALHEESVIESCPVACVIAADADSRLLESDAIVHAATLTADQPDCEFWLRTDGMTEHHRFRFHHVP